MYSSGIGGSSSSERAGRLVREAVTPFAGAVGIRTDSEAADAITAAVVGDGDDDTDNNFNNDNNEMGYLGELVSKYLIASEELVLDLIGMTDSDVSKFASTSALLSVEGNHSNKRYDNIIKSIITIITIVGE